MSDRVKTKRELIAELADLRQRLAAQQQRSPLEHLLRASDHEADLLRGSGSRQLADGRQERGRQGVMATIGGLLAEASRQGKLGLQALWLVHLGELVVTILNLCFKQVFGSMAHGCRPFDE